MPALAAPVAALADAAGYPVLAEPTSQLRWGPDAPSSLVSAYDLIARERPRSLAPELVVRFGDMPTSKALRQWLARRSRGCARSSSTRSATGRSRRRRAETVLRADPAAACRRARPSG